MVEGAFSSLAFIRLTRVAGLGRRVLGFRVFRVRALGFLSVGPIPDSLEEGLKASIVRG